MLLKLHLFGGIRAFSPSGQPVALPAGKAAALLAYLAVSRAGGEPREMLAALLWGDSD